MISLQSQHLAIDAILYYSTTDSLCFSVSSPCSNTEKKKKSFHAISTEIPAFLHNIYSASFQIDLSMKISFVSQNCRENPKIIHYLYTYCILYKINGNALFLNFLQRDLPCKLLSRSFKKSVQQTTRFADIERIFSKFESVHREKKTRLWHSSTC